MNAAKQYGGGELKRFVLLGSAVSVLNSFEDITKEGKPYTEKDWNPVRVAGPYCWLKMPLIDSRPLSNKLSREKIMSSDTMYPRPEPKQPRGSS